MLDRIYDSDTTRVVGNQSWNLASDQHDLSNVVLSDTNSKLCE